MVLTQVVAKCLCLSLTPPSRPLAYLRRAYLRLASEMDQNIDCQFCHYSDYGRKSYSNYHTKVPKYKTRIWLQNFIFAPL